MYRVQGLLLTRSLDIQHYLIYNFEVQDKI